MVNHDQKIYANLHDNDVAAIREDLESNRLLSVITVAAAYSTPKNQVSAEISKLVIEEAASNGAVAVCHAIWLLNDLINKDHEPVVDRAVASRVTKYMFAAIQKRVEADAPELFAADSPLSNFALEPLEEVHAELLGFVRSCSETQYRNYLLHISSIGDTMLVLSNELVAATLERAQDVLRDDRAFFLTLYAGIATSTLESALNELAHERAYTEMAEKVHRELEECILEMFHEQGFELERKTDEPDEPGTHTYVARRANKSTTWSPEPTDAYPQEPRNPYSGTAWVADHQRRKNTRRR